MLKTIVIKGSYAMKNRKLTFTESLMLVAGAGIGTGILTIPYALNKIGILGTVTALALAYLASALMYLIIAELTLNSDKSSDLIGILDQHLFSGKGRKVLNIVFFVLLVLLLLENLVVYVLCASDVLSDFFGINANITKIIFYALSSVVVFFGVKGLGIGEKFSVGLIGAVVLLLTVLSVFNVKGSLDLGFGEPSLVFAVYGLFMFAFSAIFSIIQVCNHIEKPELTGRAVLGGLTLNALITVVFAVAAMLGSESVTEIATIGLSDGIGNTFVKAVCALFVILAMLSSFWSSGFAFADVVSKQFKMPEKLAWFVSTLPALLISIFLPLTVLDYVQIGAGALSVILVIVVLPAYRNAVMSSKREPLLKGFAKSKILLAVTAISICLMAISSFIPIN